MDSSAFQNYAWAKYVAQKVLDEIDDIVVAVVLSVEPSPDKDVSLQIYDPVTGAKL